MKLHLQRELGQKYKAVGGGNKFEDAPKESKRKKPQQQTGPLKKPG